MRIYAPGASRYDHAQSCTTGPAALLLEGAMGENKGIANDFPSLERVRAGEPPGELFHSALLNNLLLNYKGFF